MSESNHQIILGIPGCWKDRSELITSIAAAGGGDAKFLALGGMMMKTGTKEVYELDVYDHDPRMAELFQSMSGDRFSDAEIQAIAEHTFTVYLLGPDQTRATAWRMLGAAEHLLDAGGLGVKVETTGVCHTPERWRSFANKPDSTKLYDAFSVIVTDEDDWTTCGMHNLGLPDASAPRDLDFDDASETLGSFHLWQLIESPQLSDGDDFSIAATRPDFRIRHGPYGYPEDSYLNNPHGKWVLEHAESGGAPDPKWQSPAEPQFMMLKTDSPEVWSTVKHAQATLDYFLDHFRDPLGYGSHLVKIQVRDGDHNPRVWASLLGIEGDELVCQFFELPAEFEGHQAGDRIRVTCHEIEDWSITRYATMIGGFSRRLQRSYMPDDELRSFDLYSGVLSRAPLAEIPGYES